MFAPVIIASLLVILVSLLGAIFFFSFASDFLNKNLRVLVGFSGGVFSYVAFGLAMESLEYSTPTNLAIALILGIIISSLLFKFVRWFHHHHRANDTSHQHIGSDTYNIIYGDALHNIIDGMLLAAAFAVNLTFGILTTLSIIVHEIIQETSEFIILKNAGFETMKAILVNFATSATILIGVYIGIIYNGIEEYLWLFFGMVAGVYIVIILHDIIPEMKLHKSLKSLIGFGIGITTMYTLHFLAGH